MPKRISGHLLATGFFFLNDVLYTSAFTEENVNAVILVHDFFETCRFRMYVDRNLRNEDRVNIHAFLVQAQTRYHILDKRVAIHTGRGRSKITTASPHYLVNTH